MLMPVKAKLNDKKVIIACVHWRVFPPRLALEDNAEKLWSEGNVEKTEFQRYQVWKRVCGKKAMDPVGCLSCNLVRTLEVQNHLPVMVTLDGKTVIPTTDIPTMDLLPKHRGNLILGIRPKSDWNKK